MDRIRHDQGSMVIVSSLVYVFNFQILYRPFVTYLFGATKHSLYNSNSLEFTEIVLWLTVKFISVHTRTIPLIHIPCSSCHFPVDTLG